MKKILLFIVLLFTIRDVYATPKMIGKNLISVNTNETYRVKTNQKCVWSSSNFLVKIKGKKDKHKIVVRALNTGKFDLTVKCNNFTLIKSITIIEQNKILGNILTTDTHDEKLKKLFNNKIPKKEEEIEQQLVLTSIPITTKKGKKIKKNIFIHKKLVPQVKEIFKEIQDSGFIAYKVEVYNRKYRTNKNNKKELSDHAYGVAIDINPLENCYKINNKCYSGKFYKPNKSKYSIKKNSTVYNAFIKRGWIWGGDWTNGKDYMHFSFAGE